MSDKTLTEQDDEELHIVEVDENDNPISPPADPKPAEEKPADPPADADEDEEDDDSRLGAHEDENDPDTAERNKRLREQRKARRERAKAHAEREREELRLIREQNALMQQRLQQLEAATLGGNAAMLQQKREKLLADAKMADDIRAAAISAGNGADVVQAEQIRDQLRAEAEQLGRQIGEFETARQRAVQPQADPNVARYRDQWVAANPWYDAAGRDPDSAAAKRIDAELVREGFNPATPSYWVELSTRCGEAFGEAPAAPKGPAQKGPPVGTTREHAPPSTRNNEIRVTPERKAAMIEAGVWDDPVRRQRVLKAYRDHDNQSKAN